MSSMALTESAVAQQPQHRVKARQDRSAALLYVSCGGGLGRPAGSRDRAAVRERLTRLNVSVDMAADIPEAFARLAERRYSLCVLDLAAGRAAITAIRVIRAQHPGTFVVGVVDSANPVAAAEAIHAGFVDLLPWPFEPADVLALLANAEDRKGIEPEQFFSFGLVRGVVANSAAMQQAMLQVRRAADSRGGVLVSGEAGSGRRMLARAVHTSFEDGARRPFISVDCGGDPTAVEMTLFGVSERRSEPREPSAPERVSGQSALVAARGGTLFLERLEDLPARLQARLVRILRDREATLGDRQEVVTLDVRPMASVTPGVDDAVADGRLRSDLFERLSQTRLEAPPLRRRREDIPVLAAHLLRRECTEQLCDIKTFSRSALALLAALPWRGNAAELQTLVQTLCRTSRRLVIQLDDVLQHASLDAMGARLEAGTTLREARMQFERDCISAVLVKHQGRVGDAAKALGIQRTNLYRKVRQLNVSRTLLVARR